MQLRTVSDSLTQAGRNIDRIDARLLLQHVLGVDHAFILTHPDHVLTDQQHGEYTDLVNQRTSGQPVAYLLGERAFYDLVFKVNEAVLIPRPETELLVDWALQILPEKRALRILDLGTGSGALAITIAKHRPLAHVTGIDVSSEAITVAEINAGNLGIRNVQFRLSNWFDELSADQFDLIVANPPYVAEHDPHLQQGDLRFEPMLALSAGEQGLACIRQIIRYAPHYLTQEGWLLLEHGYDQAESCRSLLEQAAFDNICSLPDLAGIMRVSGGQMQFAK